MHRSHTCGELRSTHIGQTVKLSGWVQRSRDLGGMTFVDLRDRYGITQLAFNMETNAPLCEAARKLGREFVIKATGTVVERSSKMKVMVVTICACNGASWICAAIHLRIT